MDNKKCHFLHAAFDDDWWRCPYPEEAKEYQLADGSNAWYCNEAAEAAREKGILPPKGGGRSDG